MGISLNSREKMMVIALVSILYLFIAAKFVVLPAIPQYEEVKSEIASLESQKAGLDSELKNIEAKRIDLKNKTINDQRVEEYLMSNAGIPESIEFIEKISTMVGKQLENVSINRPAEKTASVTAAPVPSPSANETDKAKAEQTEKDQKQAPAAPAPTKYYEFSIGFKTVLTYDETVDLVKYCEGGTKKVKISMLDMTPAKDEGQSEQKFDVRMNLCFYSLNMGAADKVYEYSRLKFHKHVDGDSLPLINLKEDADGNVMIPEIANSEAVKQTQQDGSFNTAYSDINIKEMGFLVGSENFELYSNYNKNQRIRIKTKERISVNIDLNTSGYRIDAVENGGTIQSLSGILPERDTIVVYVDVSFPSVSENDKLGIDIKFTNNSGKKVAVRLKDSGSKVKLMDRNGTLIYNKNQKENLDII